MKERFLTIRQGIYALLALLLLVAGSSRCAFAFSRPAKHRNIWLCPSDPAAGKIPFENYKALFSDKGSWPTVRANTRVFKVYGDFITELSERDLKIFFSYLKRHHIALALEAGVLTAQESCGHHVEGYVAPSRPLWSVTTARRIRSLGGDLKYVAMDEPLYFGHYYSGRSACESSIDVIARDAVRNLQGFQSVFPDVKVGDIEPMGGTPPEDWKKSVRAWIKAYQQAAGEPLAFYQVDVAWRNIGSAAPDNLTRLADLLAVEKVPLGVIINGDPNPQSDTQWVESAKRNIERLDELGVKPAQVIFQSWARYPRKLVPETEADTMTGLVEYYIQHTEKNFWGGCF